MVNRIYILSIYSVYSLIRDKNTIHGKKLIMFKLIIENITKYSQKLLPHTCVICQLPCKDQLSLCHACMSCLPWNTSSCSQCAVPLVNHTPNIRCGNCLNKKWAFEQCVAPLNYENEVKQLITGLKFKQKLISAHILGSLLSHAIISHYRNNTLPEAIIPVPLHAWRLRARGFNQALEISKTVHRLTKIPILKNHCKKTKRTKPQMQLNKKERQHNVKNAFIVQKKINYQYVVIIDDVFTTGNTVQSLASTLKKQGIKQIDVWCCARAY